MANESHNSPANPRTNEQTPDATEQGLTISGQPRTDKPTRTRAGYRATTRHSKARFIKCFSTNANVSMASKAAKVGRACVYEWLHKDPAFAVAYQHAQDEALDLLEKECVRRAVVGWKEPVYQGGKEVGTIRKFSDNLLIFLLKGKRPEVFRERHELTGANGAPLPPAVVHVSYHAGMKPPEEE